MIITEIFLMWYNSLLAIPFFGLPIALLIFTKKHLPNIYKHKHLLSPLYSYHDYMVLFGQFYKTMKKQKSLYYVIINAWRLTLLAFLVVAFLWMKQAP